MSVKTFAAIDVGSFELTMKIFDFSGKNTMREIDCIRQRIDLGSDTYANGKISNEKMDDLCHTLKEFAQIMESYKVIAYKAYGTSAIRETENALILQDRAAHRHPGRDLKQLRAEISGLQVDCLQRGDVPQDHRGEDGDSGHWRRKYSDLSV